MKDGYKKLLSIVTLLLIILLTVYYFRKNLPEFASLSLQNPFLLIPLVILFIIVTINNGLIIKAVSEPFDIKMGFKEWFGLSCITSFYNMILFFRGGAIVRGVYLKKKYNFSYSQFLATLSGIYLVGFFVAFLAGVICLTYLYLFKGIFNGILFTLFVVGFFLFLIAMIFFPEIKEPKNKIIAHIVKVSNGWSFVSRKRKIIVVVALVSIANIILTALMLYLEFKMFNSSVPISIAILLASINSLSILLAFTPGALGIKEVILVFSALALGVPTEIAVAVSLLDRLISLIVLFILGPIYSYILLRKPKNELKKT